MWVCGEIGYAATTSGRHRATVSATAREPSICLRMAHSLGPAVDQARACRRPAGRCAVERLRPRRRTAAAIAPLHRLQAHRRRSGRRRRRAARCWAGAGRAAAGPGRSPARVTHALTGRSRARSRPSSAGVREVLTSTTPSSASPSRTSRDAQQRRVLDHHHVRVVDRVVRPDRRGRRSGSTATTGAPVRSEPKLGSAWACRPWSKAATDSSSAAVTTPWPPRPWIRISSS